MENWRGVVAPPDILPAERDAMVAAMERLHAAPGWQEALERNGWTDFFKPGDEFTAFLRSEDERVDRIIADLGLGDMTPRSWRGPRAWGLAPARPRDRGARRDDGDPQPGGLRGRPVRASSRWSSGSSSSILAVLFLARTLVRPDIELAERAAREQRSTDWAPPALVVAALLAYALLMEPLGYVVATTLFFPVVARILGSRAPVRDVIVGLVLGAVLYVAFTQFLGIDLPAGLTPIT